MKSLFNKALKLGIIATLTGCFFGKTKTVDSQPYKTLLLKVLFTTLKFNRLKEKRYNFLNSKERKY